MTMRSVIVVALAAGLSFPLIAGVQGQMAPPMVKAHIYDEKVDPRGLIREAVQKAAREHKHVIVDFGGDWCGDCQVLHAYFEQEPNRSLLTRNYELVNVYVGHIDKNLEIPESYGVNIHKGVPALAVLDGKGHVLFAQKSGEFENMRSMNASSVTQFLDRWKP